MNNKFSQSLKVAVALSLLSAISIVAGKYLAIRGGDIMRFSFENLPIILAGVLFGPLSAMLVGVVADLVGCVLVGYAINPIVTLGAAALGLCSGAVWRVCKRMKFSHLLCVSLTVLISHAVGSVLIKTFGLAKFYEVSFGVLMLWRTLNYLIVGVLECVLVYILMKNKMFLSAVKPLLRRQDK